MKYEEMTRKEIADIVNKGGDQLAKLNKMVAGHLGSLRLSDKAREQVDLTDINAMAEVFGGCFTEEDVEKLVREC